jgi:hypothetical protein
VRQKPRVFDGTIGRYKSILAQDNTSKTTKKCVDHPSLAMKNPELDVPGVLARIMSSKLIAKLKYVPICRSSSGHGSRTRGPRDDGFKVVYNLNHSSRSPAELDRCQAGEILRSVAMNIWKKDVSKI